jgi:hypothetical protein
MQDTLFDEYVVAHTIGWWCKAIMIRNQPCLWFLSIAFEFCEVSFPKHGNYIFFEHSHADIKGTIWYELYFSRTCFITTLVRGYTRRRFYKDIALLQKTVVAYILHWASAEDFHSYAPKLQRVLVG